LTHSKPPHYNNISDKIPGCFAPGIKAYGIHGGSGHGDEEKNLPMPGMKAQLSSL